MDISMYFHKNVFLLTQIFPTTDEFKRHYRQGMFDKPNTIGFIYVSRYLLMIYDPERFKQSIQWPIICKLTERKYRDDVKNLLCGIAQENPDMCFPLILTTYLLRATGTMFTMIMWKLSIVALRKYIQRECDQNVLHAPISELAGVLIKKHLTDIITSKLIDIETLHLIILQTEEAAKIIVLEEEIHLNKIKNELFETKQSTMYFIREAPVDASIKNCLTNVENTECIKMWKRHLTECIDYIEKKNTIWKNIEILSGNLARMIMNKINNTNGKTIKQFIKMNSFTSELLLLPDIQCLLNHLYKDDKMILYNFISYFNVLLHYLYQRFKEYKLNNLSSHLLQLEASCEDMKEARNMFENVFIDITTFLVAEQNLYEKKFNRYEDDTTYNAIFPTPRIKIYTDCDKQNDDLQRRLEVTPDEGKYKSIFARYKRTDFNNSPHTPQLKGNLLISRINFNNSLSLNNNERNPQTLRHSPRINCLTKQYTEKYSRLFTSTVKEKSSRVNCELIFTPTSSKTDSTSIPDKIEKIHIKSQINLNNTIQDFLQLNNKIKENISKRNENNNQESITKNSVEEKSTEKDNRNKKRWSISDLVQRYKHRILKNIDQTEIHTKKSDSE